MSTVGNGIIRLTPVALPGFTRPGVRFTTAPLLRAQLRWALRRLRATPQAIVATNLEDVLGRWGRNTINVLYGTDDYVAGAKLMGLSADRLRVQERWALDRADVVLAISPELAERWRVLGADPIVLPNGCDADAYRGVDRPTVMLGIDLPAPVVGVVGQLSDRIEIGLLEAVADAGLSLLLVGPRDERWEPERFAALTARRTVHHTGLVPSENLPIYLAMIDVGLTPYADTPFNRASFPLKTLEYLAAGRPVVSTDLPASRWLLDNPGARTGELYVASGPGDFVAAVRVATAAGGTNELATRCRALAARHSWQRRVEEFGTAVGLPAPSTSHALHAPAATHLKVQP
jgi:teichuronic acid biosynthesis glycosyltransferase TuaH